MDKQFRSKVAKNIKPVSKVTLIKEEIQEEGDSKTLAKERARSKKIRGNCCH